ncbi:TRAP transporter small permease subunit [Seohaeicola saemankumensis]|uniref:TRAP transporter small permease protein n=1 Tax=Seohaeicola saemankumensis TaxID=481181 RepID=A0ABW3TDS6_9RHOB
MRPFLALVLRCLDGATQALNVIGSGLILLLMILVGVDVAGRNLAGAPVAGVPELVTLSIVAIVFLQIPQALRAGRLTRSDALQGWLEPRHPGLAKWIETVFDLVSMAVIWVIVSTTWPIFTRAWERGEFIGALGDFIAPTWPVKLTILIGGSMLILQFAARILRRWIPLSPAEARP